MWLTVATMETKKHKHTVLGDNIRRLRKVAGISAEVLAKRARISSVRMIEAGQVEQPRMETVKAIASILGLEWSALYDPAVEPVVFAPAEAAPRRRRRSA